MFGRVTNALTALLAEPAPPPTRELFAIWWTTQAESEAIMEHFASDDLPLPECCPQYLRSEFRSRCGRNGRGRLWVAKELGDVELVPWDEDGQLTAIETWIERASAAGIVVRAEHVERLLHLPGLVTTLTRERWTT